VGKHPENWLNSADTVKFKKRSRKEIEVCSTPLTCCWPGTWQCITLVLLVQPCAQRCLAAVEREFGITSVNVCCEGFLGS